MWTNHNELACQRLYTVPGAVVQLAVVIEIDFSGAAVEEYRQGEWTAGFPKERNNEQSGC